MTRKRTNTLIIGAGPFGLSIAAQCQQQHTDYLIVGKPMEFWHNNMPKGMLLRSDSSWHIDPSGKDTIDEFLRELEQSRTDVEPLTRSFYLDYLDWFVQKKDLKIYGHYVHELSFHPNAEAKYRAKISDGTVIEADHVVLATGFKYFKHEPTELIRLFPQDSCHHTCDFVNFSGMAGKRCLIIGGRQSAFEWAALLLEAGASNVHLVHRHDSPAFEDADWTWVDELVEHIAEEPGWFRKLNDEEKESYNHRLWAEGRLKVEPWLKSRVLQGNTHLWPNTRVHSCEVLDDGTKKVILDNHQDIGVDEIILATGYQVNVDKIPFLSKGNILSSLAIRNGYPVLDEFFQTNIPGLYMTSMAAVQDFGPFFAFTISVRTSAKLIGKSLLT